MGMIINIDQALEQRSEYNILREPLNDMLRNEQEAWEKQNPIDFLFTRSSLDKFQETYTSSIGFAHAFSETADYSKGQIYNTAEGFSATYRTRTFEGGFVITQQVLEDQAYNKSKDMAQRFIKRWNGDIVEYCMTAVQAGFGKDVFWGDESNGGKSRLNLKSADTTDGDINTATKNPLFSKKHTRVKRDNMSAADITGSLQSNMFCVKDGDKYGIDLAGSDPGMIAKLADVIDQVVTYMENLYDDNGKRAGVNGGKRIVCGNDPHLKAALTTAVSLEMFNDFGQMKGLNPGYKRVEGIDITPYLLDIPACKGGVGFFIVDKAYMAANHGLELTERIALTLDVTTTQRPLPRGILYDGRQRFDVNVATWRGIAYVYIGSAAPTWSESGALTDFTEIVPTATAIKPVNVVNAAEIGA